MAPPTPWPIAFTAAFATNLSWSSVPDGSPAGLPGTFSLPGLLQYDASKEAQRIDHIKGGMECRTFYNTTGPCTLLMLKSGMYRLLPYPLPAGQPACCLDMPSIHAPPRGWANTTGVQDVGRTTVPYTNVLSSGFQYPFTGHGGSCDTRSNATDSGCHAYFEVAGGPLSGLPALFTFPANDGRQDWYFDPSSITTASQLGDDIFALPPGCEGTPCPGASRHLVAGPHVDLA